MLFCCESENETLIVALIFPPCSVLASNIVVKDAKRVTGSGIRLYVCQHRRLSGTHCLWTQQRCFQPSFRARL